MQQSGRLLHKGNNHKQIHHLTTTARSECTCTTYLQSSNIWPHHGQLHWLSIYWWIQYKLCLLMHSIHRGRSPMYLVDIVEPASNRSTRRLRSTESSLYDVHAFVQNFAREYSHSLVHLHGTLSLLTSKTKSVLLPSRGNWKHSISLWRLTVYDIVFIWQL